MDITAMIPNKIETGKVKFEQADVKIKDCLNAICDVALLKEKSDQLNATGMDANEIKTTIDSMAKNNTVIGKCVNGAELHVAPHIASFTKNSNPVEKRIDGIIKHIMSSPTLFANGDDPVSNAFTAVKEAQNTLKRQEELLASEIGYMLEYLISEKDKYINNK